MRSLFEFSNYRDFLREYVYGEDTPRGTQVQLAKSMGCQAAYLSQVLKDRADLSEEQALRLAKHLELSETASSYLITLVRLARAGSIELKTHIEREREKLLSESNEIQSRLVNKTSTLSEAELLSFLSSWIPSTVHMATSSEKYRTVDAIAERLQLPPSKVKETVHLLESLGLVEKTGKEWIFKSKSTHFPRQSTLNTVHHMHRRMQALRSIETNPGPSEAMHFSSIFTIDPKTFKKLHNECLSCIQRTNETVHSSGSDELYGMCLDVFRIV